MRETATLFRQIAHFNFLRWAGRGEEYFTRHFSSLGWDLKQSHYAALLRCGRGRLGSRGVMVANAALALGGLALSLGADALNLWLPGPAAALGQGLCLIFCLMKFDLLNFRDRRTVLKLLFAVWQLLIPVFCALPYAFLVLFENIAY